MSFWKNLHPLLRKDKDDYGSANSAILNAIDSSLSEAERAEVATKVQRSLDTATGEYLDYWGRWFNTARREDETDDTYRERIKYYLLMGRGTVQGIIDGLKYWLQDNALYAEVYEPWYNIFTLNKSKLNGEDSIAGSYYRYAVIDVKLDRPISKEILDIIYAYKPAGVILYTTYEPNLNIKANALTLANINTNFKEQTLSNYGGIGDYGGNIIGFGDLDEVAMQSMNHTLFTTNDSKTNGEDYISSNIFSGQLYSHTAWSWSEDGTDGFTTSYPGENLLKNTSDFSSNWSAWPGQFSISKTTEYDGHPSLEFTSSSSLNYALQDGVGAKKSSQYTSSFWAKADNAGDKAQTELYGSIGITNFVLTTDWVHYSAVLTSGPDVIEDTIYYVGVHGGNKGNVYIALPKLEKGSVATPYTPSPLDDPEGAYPKFIGTYTDYIADDSTDPTKYTWVRVQDPQDSIISDSDIGIKKQSYYVGLSGAHRNLITGTSGPFVMGFGIPNTAWDTTNQVSRISLPVTTKYAEVLPQNAGFPYTWMPGVTYTQSIYISTDAPLTGTPISFTWVTYNYGHNTSGADNLVKVSTNVYRATSTYTWPSSNSPANGRTIDLMNLTQVFDFTKGTFLNFYKPKVEQGNTVTDWSPAPEDNVLSLPDTSSTWVQEGIRQATKLEDNVKSGNIFNNGNNNIFGEIRIQEFLLSKYSIKDSGNILATSTLSPYIEVSGVLRGNANIVISQVSHPILNGRTLIPIKTSDIIKDSNGISKIPFCLVGEEGTTLDLDKIVFGYKFLREKETGVAVSADHVIKSVN